MNACGGRRGVQMNACGGRTDDQMTSIWKEERCTKRMYMEEKEW